MNFSNVSLQIGSGLLTSQVFDLFGGLFLLLIGAAIFYTLASWRLRGIQVDGEIIGVRRRGPYFHGVYRFVMPNGEHREATSVQSRNSSKGLQTGRRVPIQVMPDKLHEARERHAPLLWSFAIGLLLSGTSLIYVGTTVSKHNPIVWVLIVLALGLTVYWLWRRMKALFAKLQPVSVPEPWTTLPIEPTEFVGALPTLTPHLRSTRSKSQNTGVIFVVLGVGMFALIYWQARALLELRHGVQTSGIVVELSEGSTGSSSDTFLFPVVQYTGQDGRVVRFHDRTGARPSPLKVGDRVPVMYLPGKPTTAKIDRGFSNWGPLGWMAAMGIILTTLGFLAMRSR